METHTDTDTGWFQPFAGWEAAARWNRATFDWVAKGWQQWVALMTTVPPRFVVPPTISQDATQRVAEQVRAAKALDAQLRSRHEPVIATRAMARTEARGTKRTKATPRPRTAKKAGTRG